MGQMTDFKANILSTNERDTKASIQVLVDEIWCQYDVDDSGVLEKDEVKQFVKEYLPELKQGFKYSEDGFEALFKEFDLDGNGSVDRFEMTEFIKKIAA